MDKLLDYITRKHENIAVSVKEAARLLEGKQYLCDDRGIYYEVIVKEVSMKVGNTRCLVVPVAGKGERWVRPIDLYADVDQAQVDKTDLQYFKHADYMQELYTETQDRVRYVIKRGET